MSSCKRNRLSDWSCSLESNQKQKQGKLLYWAGRFSEIKATCYVIWVLEWDRQERRSLGILGRTKTWRRNWEMLDLIWSRASRKANSKWFHYSTPINKRFSYSCPSKEDLVFIVSLQAKESAHLKEKNARENKGDLDQNCSWFFFHIMSQHGPLDYFLENSSPSSRIWSRISLTRNWWLGINMRDRIMGCKHD